MQYKRLEISGILAVIVGYISEDRERTEPEPKQITSNLIGINTY